MSEIEVIAPPNLAELAETINREHALAARAGTAYLEASIAAGEALLQARRQIARGGWCSWLKANVQIHEGTCYRYMRYATYKERITGLPNGHAANEALIGLQLHESDTLRPRTIEEHPLYQRVHDLIDAGLSQRKIAKETGVNVNTVNKLANPDKHRTSKAAYLERSNARLALARKALERNERAAEAKRAGGGVSELYSLLRQAEQVADGLARDGAKPEIRRWAHATLRRLYRSTDEFGGVV